MEKHRNKLYYHNVPHFIETAQQNTNVYMPVKQKIYMFGDKI